MRDLLEVTLNPEVLGEEEESIGLPEKIKTRKWLGILEGERGKVKKNWKCLICKSETVTINKN